MPNLTALYVNDYDLSRIGFILERADGWPDGLGANLRTLPIRGRDGELVLPPESQTLPRTLDVHGWVKDTSSALIRTDIDALKDRLYAGQIELRVIDRLDRYIVGRCRQFKVDPIGPSTQMRGAKLDFTLLCPDPVVYDTNATEIGLSTLRAALPIGTCLVRPLIRIMGAINNPVLTYRDLRGTSKQTLGFTVNLAATDYLEIDCELGTVTKYVSGASSDGITLLTSGDFIAIAPADGSYSDAIFPTLELNGGTGFAIYKRGWA